MSQTRSETLTGFLRRPKEILRHVDRQDVVLVRTGGKPAIRLSLESRAAASSAGSEMVAQLLAEVLAAIPGVPDRLAGALGRRLPWIRLLPDPDRRTFVQEFVETLEACAAVGNPARLDELLGDWKATAAIHADPALATELRRALRGGSARVPRPRARTARAQKR